MRMQSGKRLPPSKNEEAAGELNRQLATQREQRANAAGPGQASLSWPAYRAAATCWARLKLAQARYGLHDVRPNRRKRRG
jgi:hypothetical protein